MDKTLRDIFTAHYSETLYRRVCSLMEERLDEPHFGFRLAEVPFIVPGDLLKKLAVAAEEILAIIRRPENLAAGLLAVPGRYRVRGLKIEDEPEFVAIDFAVARGEGGELVPRLIELQGFPSLYAMQLVQGEIWGEVLAGLPGMPERFTPLFSGLDRAGYLDLLKRTIVGDGDLDGTILLDLHPEQQKTRPDFHATRRLLGVRTVDAATIVKDGRTLLAPKDGKLVPVQRIYNRIVFDELERKAVHLPFDWRDDLDVRWVCHPDWYWIWSKHTLPRIEHPAAPWTRILSEVDTLPRDCGNYILKPLFSFAGTGVNPDLTEDALAAIPAAERSQWILQEKVDYAPALLAPDGTGVKAEIRMMFLKPQGGDYTLAINLTRLSRGKIHGVDHNKGLDWVGSSVGVWPEPR
ncbi:MAG TPA: hypothetical protein VFV19_12475 [Candidatus Polarisedimenticolaceae bacterium]|nr:hypothetical protein [Candidatus Polarisedimenticolaceae bacterium]